MLQSTERASAKLLKLLFLWGSFHDKLSFTKTSQTWAQAQHFVVLWETQEDNYIPSSHLDDWNIPPLMPSENIFAMMLIGLLHFLPSSPPVANNCVSLNAAVRMSAVQDRPLLETPTLGWIFWREVQHRVLSVHCESQSKSSQRGKKSALITSQMSFHA